MFPYNSFHADYEGDTYFYVQQFLQKLGGLLQHHVSPFIPPVLLDYPNIFRFTK